MFRAILAGVLAGIALFMWGFVSWVVLPWHNETFRELPDEEVVSSTLKRNLERPGTYMIPWIVESTINSEEERATAMKAMEERHKVGPIVQIFYQPEGEEPMAPAVLGRGVAIDIGIGIVAAWILSLTLAGRPNYVQRVCTILLVGIFSILMTHVTDWNFMYRPVDYTMVMCMDHLVGALVVGLVAGAIVRPPRQTT